MPDWKAEVRKQLVALDLAPAREIEIVEELAQHLEDRYAELRAGDATREQAYRAVLAEISQSETLQRVIALRCG